MQVVGLRHANADVDAPVATSQPPLQGHNPTAAIVDKYLILLKSVGTQDIFSAMSRTGPTTPGWFRTAERITTRPHG